MESLIKDENRCKKLLANLPTSPGVYLMKDEAQKVIYVGKAKHLRKRVRHYFQSGPNHSIGTRVMMPKIYDITTISVSSEIEALLLEINLIKEHKPRYNVIMRDDKNYAYLKITMNEDYPRIVTTRKREKDKALYFGPYMSVKKVRDALDSIKKIFPYRTCKGTIDWLGKGVDLSQPVNLGILARYKPNVMNKNLGRKIPCLEYHIKRCNAPCLGIISKENYLHNILKIARFLKGNYDEVLKEIQESMRIAIAEKKFEWAARLRDQMLLIQELQGKQSVVNTDVVDQDVMALAVEDKLAVVTILHIRSGKLLHILHRELKIEKDSSYSEIFERCIVEHYPLVSDYPNEILISYKFEDYITDLIENWFRKSFQVSTKLFFPQRGQKKDLIRLAEKNAEQYLQSRKASYEESIEEKGMKALREILSLSTLPQRIECYDISHIQGTNTVASMVVLLGGKPVSSHYRRFQVKTVSNRTGEPDDYQSMYEVLGRRLKHLQNNVPHIHMRKATRSVLYAYVEKRYNDKIKEKLEWYEASTENYRMIFGVQVVDDTVSVISTYLQEGDIPNDIRMEMFLSLMYKIKAHHIYLNIVQSDAGLCTALGATEVESIPEKYHALAVDGDVVFTWYKKSKRRQKADVSFSSKPDLIVIDGGKGQVSKVKKIMKEIGRDDIPVIGLAKREEEIIIPDQKNPMLLPLQSPALRLIIRARDESHRFAQKYHKEKRGKAMIQSELDSIPGIGQKTKKKLLDVFGSVAEIRKAPLETLEEYVGRRTAKILETYLKS